MELDLKFESVCVEHRRMLVRLATNMLRNPGAAEDAVQEALYKAWRGLPDYRGKAALKTWLTRIVIHQCLMRMRSVRLHCKNADEIKRHCLSIAVPNPEQLCMVEETRALVNREIRRSPALYRAALLSDLAIFESDATLVALLAQLGITRGCGVTRRRRARIWLRARMERYAESHAI